MNMVANVRISPAADDTTDTCDGESRVITDAFWPEIVLHDLRLAVRLPGRTTTSRLMHAAIQAVAHVTDELSDWQAMQMQAGHDSLNDVPSVQINGESIRVHRYRAAVYAATRALVLERMRDVDTTEKGDRKADALEAQTGDLWRDVRWLIADIRGAPRLYAELC